MSLNPDKLGFKSKRRSVVKPLAETRLSANFENKKHHKQSLSPKMVNLRISEETALNSTQTGGFQNRLSMNGILTIKKEALRFP